MMPPKSASQLTWGINGRIECRQGLGRWPRGPKRPGPNRGAQLPQTGAVSPVDGKKPPEHIAYPVTAPPGDQSRSAETALPVRDIMSVTLLIPEDKYEAWRSSLPEFVKIRETKILDKVDRERLGLE